MSTLTELLSTWPAADYEGIRQAAMDWHQLATDHSAATGTPRPWYPVTLIPGLVPAAHCYGAQPKDISEKQPAIWWTAADPFGGPEVVKAKSRLWKYHDTVPKLPAVLAAIDIAQARHLPLGLGLVVMGDSAAVAFDVDRKCWDEGPEGDQQFAADTAAMTAWAAASGCYIESTPGGGLHLIGLRSTDAPRLPGTFIFDGLEVEKAGEIKGGIGNGFLVVAPTFRAGKPTPYSTAMAPTAVLLPPLEQLGIQPVEKGPTARTGSTRNPAAAMAYAPAVAGPIDLATVFQDPDSDHWFERELPARQIELAISMLQAVPRRGVPGESDTYNHAFAALAALVGWRGASEALSIVSRAGWDSQYWDVADKAADIARDPRSGIGALIKLARNRYGWKHPDHERIEAARAKRQQPSSPSSPSPPHGETPTDTQTSAPPPMAPDPFTTQNTQSSQNGNGKGSKELTPEEQVAKAQADREAAMLALENEARRLLLAKEPPYRRNMALQSMAWERELRLDSSGIRGLIANARASLRGTPQGVTAGQVVKVRKQQWLVQGFIPSGLASLVVAEPKVGKTALVIGAIAALHHGYPDFLGMELSGPCPPVLILGPDMTTSEWVELLAPVGLAEWVGEEEARFLPPIQFVWSKETNLTLNEEGFELIEQKLQEHPGAILLCDSYAELTAGLGLDEWKSDAADPLRDLQFIASSYGATTIAIHHSGKSRSGERASSASRGTNALPAAVNHVTALRWLEATGPGGAPPQNKHVVLGSQGRGLGTDLVIEQINRGQWILHGTGAQIAAEAAIAKKRDKLNPRQKAVLLLVERRWAEEKASSVVGDLLREIGEEFTGADPERMARNTLEQLYRTHGLLEQIVESLPDRGVVATYRPSGWRDAPGLQPPDPADDGGVVRRVARGGVFYASSPSSPPPSSSSPHPPTAQLLPQDPSLPSSGEEGEEGKEGQNIPPRARELTLLNPNALADEGEEGDNTTAWLEHALAIRQQFPTIPAFSIAVELQADHGLRLSPDTVQAALDAHDAAAAA